MCIVEYAQNKCQAYSFNKLKFAAALFTSKNDPAESIAAHVLNHHSASSNNRWFSGGCTGAPDPRASGVRTAPAVMPIRVSTPPANHRYDNTSKSLSLIDAPKFHGRCGCTCRYASTSPHRTKSRGCSYPRDYLYLPVQVGNGVVGVNQTKSEVDLTAAATTDASCWPNIFRKTCR